VYELAAYEPARSIHGQKRAILAYVDHAISLYSRTGNPSIGKYAIKVISNEVIHQNNLDVVLSAVMRLSRTCPASIPDVAKFVSSYHDLGFRYDRKAIARFIESGLKSSLILGHAAESTWLLWAALRTKCKISAETAQEISKSESSPVLLLGKLLEEDRLSKTAITQRVFGRLLREEDFISQNWLLAYEGAMRGWFGWSSAQIAGSHLEELANRNIHFINLSATSGTVRRRNRSGPAPEMLSVENLEGMSLDDLDETFETEVYEDGYELIEREEDEDEEPDEDDF
jgi:hypothetical protein